MSDSLLDQMKAFGAKLGLPKVDVDKLVEMNRKNLDALVRSASVAGEGAKAFAGKQREIIQAAFKEASAMVKDFHPTGSAQEIVAKQSEYARKAFEVAMQNTRDLADLATKSTAEAARIIRERIHDSLSELQESVSSTSGNEEKERNEEKKGSEAPSNTSGSSDAATRRPKKR
jgi:phasin family protein